MSILFTVEVTVIYSVSYNVIFSLEKKHSFQLGLSAVSYSTYIMNTQHLNKRYKLCIKLFWCFQPAQYVVVNDLITDSLFPFLTVRVSR